MLNLINYSTIVTKSVFYIFMNQDIKEDPTSQFKQESDQSNFFYVLIM